MYISLKLSLRLLLTILLLFVSAVGFSQKKTRYGKLIASIPFNMYHSGVMTIKAKYPGVQDSLRFILDTGSGGASLDSTTCAENGIETVPTNVTVSGIGARRKVNFVYNKDLNFPDVKMEDFNFHINDYQILEAIYGERIDGILGFQFFSRYTVMFDFDNYVIDLYEIGSFKKRKFSKRKLHTKIRGIPSFVLPMQDNKELSPSMYFDSGAGLCLLLSEKFVKDSTVLSPAKKLFNTQVEGMNGIINMRYTTINEVFVGPYRFKNVPAYLYQDEYNVLNYPTNGGLVGNDLLRRFNVVFDYTSGEFLLRPNKHFRDIFDYSYSGLNIIKAGDDVVVESTIPGSPAADAGIQSGDILVGINLVFAHNLQAIRAELQKVGTHKVFVSRDNNLLEFKLKTISIL